MWKFLFNSGFAAKCVFVAIAALCFWLLQVKIEKLQAQNNQKDLQISNLEQTLAHQENALTKLVQEKEKQEQEILAYEMQKQMLEQKISIKKQAFAKRSDEASKAWKEQEIPLPILAILQGKTVRTNQE